MIIENLENINYPDYIIIGAGPAGITLALELEKKNLNVFLIEAGGLEVSEKNQSRYKGVTFGDKYFDLDVTRLSMLGGSSNHWGGNCSPLDEIDLKNWPINKAELDNYENRTKKILEIKNSFVKYKTSKLNSFNLNSSEQSNVNFKDKYFDQLKNSQNILLLLNTNVERFICSDSNPKIVEKLIINFANQKKEIKFKPNTKFILSCGGLENSRILLWSQINSKDSFLKNLPIGNYWMEHPSGEIGQFIGEKVKIDELFENKANFSLVPSKTFLKTKKINNVRFDFFFWEPLNQKSLKHKLKDLICIAPNLGKKIIESISTQIVHCTSTVKFNIEQKPDYNNKITLSSSEKDVYGMPRIELNWNIKDDVFNSLRIALEELGREFINNGIGRIGIDRFVYDNSFKNSQDIFANHHHMGGTVMENDNFSGVVDKNLKIKNTNNLFVIGSSVFPTSGLSNPTYTIIQLALRLSDHLTSYDNGNATA